MKQFLDKYEESLNLSNSWQLERLKGAKRIGVKRKLREKKKK